MGGNDHTVEVPISAVLGQINDRLSNQDAVLGRIDNRLVLAASKEDVRRVEKTVDGVAHRVTRLEEKQAEGEAIEGLRERFRRRAAWVVSGVAVPIVAALLYVFLSGH